MQLVRLKSRMRLITSLPGFQPHCLKFSSSSASFSSPPAFVIYSTALFLSAWKAAEPSLNDWCFKRSNSYVELSSPSKKEFSRVWITAPASLTVLPLSARRCLLFLLSLQVPLPAPVPAVGSRPVGQVWVFLLLEVRWFLFLLRQGWGLPPLLLPGFCNLNLFRLLLRNWD